MKPATQKPTDNLELYLPNSIILQREEHNLILSLMGDVT